MKNWQPFVLGPLFTMGSRPGAMSKLKFFICKLPLENTGNSSTISINKNLHPEIFYDLAKDAPFVSYWNPIFSEFSISELPKILNHLRYNICKEISLHVDNFLQPARDG